MRGGCCVRPPLPPQVIVSHPPDDVGATHRKSPLASSLHAAAPPPLLLPPPFSPLHITRRLDSLGAVSPPRLLTDSNTPAGPRMSRDGQGSRHAGLYSALAALHVPFSFPLFRLSPVRGSSILCRQPPSPPSPPSPLPCGTGQSIAVCPKRLAAPAICSSRGPLTDTSAHGNPAASHVRGVCTPSRDLPSSLRPRSKTCLFSPPFILFCHCPGRQLVPGPGRCHAVA